MKKIFQVPWFPLLLLALLWAFFHKALLFSGKTFILADSSTVFYPLWKWGSEVLKEGWIPLWCPDAGFGTPYLADPQNMAWYPPKVFLYSFLGPTSAFTALLLTHSLWTLVGVWCLVRDRGGSPWACFWACLLMAFCFNSVILPWSTSMPVAFSWTPWVLFFFSRLVKGKEGSWLFLSVCFALQWAAGYPLFGFMTGLFLSLDAFSRKDLDLTKIDRSLLLLAAVGLAFLFNFAWLLPLMELLPQSNLGLRAAMPAGGNWGDLGTLFDPFRLGHPLFTPDKDFIFRVYFMGLPTLALLVFGVLGRRIPRRVLAALLLLVVLSLGETAWVGGALRSILPGYQWVVRSGYWLPFLALFTALVSADVLESLLKKPLMDPRGLRFFVPLGVYGTALGLGVPWDLPGLWLSLLFLAGALLGRTPSFLRAPFFCAALAFSLFPSARAIHFTADASYFDQEPKGAFSWRGSGRIYQSLEWVESYRTLSGKGVLDAYTQGKEALVPNWGLAFGLSQTAYSHSLFLKAGLDWEAAPSRVPAESAGKLLDLLGAGSIVDRTPDGTVRFMPNPGAFPLWYSVQKAFPCGSLEEDWTRIASKGFDPRKHVLVDDPAAAGNYRTRVVHEPSRGPNRSVLRAEGEGRALLVSSEMAYPGWRAEAGGRSLPWVRVNHDFRGLVLEEGEEGVTMSFAPTTFRLGVFLSLLACALWVFGLFRRSRRSLRA